MRLSLFGIEGGRDEVQHVRPRRAVGYLGFVFVGKGNSGIEDRLIDHLLRFIHDQQFVFYCYVKDYGTFFFYDFSTMNNKDCE